MKETIFTLLHKMEGMTFTQDDILEVLQFMMNRMNQESKPFSADHENDSNDCKIIERKESLWVDVNDKLPKINQIVLVFHDPYIGIEQRTDPKDGNIWASTYKKHITHWMKIPDHPKLT